MKKLKFLTAIIVLSIISMLSVHSQIDVIDLNKDKYPTRNFIVVVVDGEVVDATCLGRGGTCLDEVEVGLQN